MKYNINELLDKKKELDSQISEMLNINQVDLTYEKQNFKDLHNNTEKAYELRPQKSLDQFSQKFNGLVSELSEIKTAISIFNAQETSALLYKRESVRNKITYLNNVKRALTPIQPNQGRKVTRHDVNNVALEVVDFEIRPMFEVEVVEKQLNEASAEERKLNTQIQRVNLNAEIELE